MFSLLFGITLSLWGFIGTLFYDAFWGLVVFSTFTHMTPQQLSEAYIVPLRIPFFLSIAVLLSYLCSAKYPRKFLHRPTEVWLMLAMVAGMALSSIYAFDSESAFNGTMTLAKYTLFFLLFVNVIDTNNKLDWFVNALILACAWMVYKCWDLRGMEKWGPLDTRACWVAKSSAKRSGQSSRATGIGVCDAAFPVGCVG